MELTNQQEQVVFNSIKLNCQQCLKLSSGICRGEGCELFSLKQIYFKFGVPVVFTLKTL